MAEFDLVVAGGRVATQDGIEACDIGVAGGRIVALRRGLGPGRETIDARGRLVLPGGVDSHCHIEQPESLGENPDTFETATRAAACGGTTTVISFADQMNAAGLAEVVEDYHRLARRSLIDYAFHIIIRRVDDRVLWELPEVIEGGVRSLKYFAASRLPLGDAEAIRLMAAAREHGALMLVHAENNDAVNWCAEQLLRAGHTAPKYQPASRPMAAEREATPRAIALAEVVGVPIQIFHVSGAEPAEEIRRAQARGLEVYGETHPHYLLLNECDADRPGFEGAKFLCSPPLRTAADNEALWSYLREGVLQAITSDHSPFNYCGAAGKQVGGPDAGFDRIPNGLPTIETRLPMLFSEGVSKGRIDLATFVSLSATGPARIFGLYPRKGRIAIGVDADLVLWDPEREATITNDALHHNVDYTPFEGWSVKGWPVTTICRGALIAHEGEVIGEPGYGRYLPRGPHEHIPPGAIGGRDAEPARTARVASMEPRR